MIRFRNIQHTYTPIRTYFINQKCKQRTQTRALSIPGSDIADNWKPLPSDRNSARSKFETAKHTVAAFAELSKMKLSALVLLTTMSGYVMAPKLISDSIITTAAVSSPGQLGITLLGTALCSFSANSFNQWAEAPFDAQMPRTLNRPLPRLILTPFAAFNWALFAGGSGVAILGFGVNFMSAGLALLTIGLYAGCYTPLKRFSIANTWVGALVGAIPPLIGWTAVLPQISAASLILPAVLFCWQFPHFNALSWNLRSEYARAGYKMASVLASELNKRVALRYSLLLVPITLAATPLGIGLTTSAFAISGNIVNAALIIQAFRFWRDPCRNTARGLFFMSLLHLPFFLFLLFWHKKPLLTDKIDAAEEIQNSDIKQDVCK